MSWFYVQYLMEVIQAGPLVVVHVEEECAAVHCLDMHRIHRQNLVELGDAPYTRLLVDFLDLSPETRVGQEINSLESLLDLEGEPVCVTCWGFSRHSRIHTSWETTPLCVAKEEGPCRGWSVGVIYFVIVGILLSELLKGCWSSWDLLGAC